MMKGQPSSVISCICLLAAGITCGWANCEQQDFNLVALEAPRILAKAQRYLEEAPCTVTAEQCAHSQGGLHDFYSQADYWWPNPDNPQSPYIKRDGQTNPDNFVAHRVALIRLSEIIGTCVSAYLITKDERYAAHAVAHLRAWFVDDTTRMNPNLLYSQAIVGVSSGRSFGVIDTIHLVEVARGAKLLCKASVFTSEEQLGVKAWFREYLHWLNTHEYGKVEKRERNNHGTCWSLQAAAFADLVGDEEVLKWIRQQFKSDYLGRMMDASGGFPAELGRTKPYGYSLFMIDAMAGVAQIASTPEDDLWTFQTPDGRSMKRGLEFIFPYVKDKRDWPYRADVMYWEQWPVRHVALLFAGVKFGHDEYLATWQKLEADPQTLEVLRNLPLRHPLLWVTPTAP